MGRILGPKCRKCRREGVKLFLKGERCYLAKCPIVKRKYPPGIHGHKGYPKLTEYGKQLREKQKIKRSYNISEVQLKNYFNKAKKKIGNTEIDLLKMLEMRLDNVVFVAGLTASRNLARQIIGHGHILVNNKRLTIPSYQVKIGDVITVKTKLKEKKQIQETSANYQDRRNSRLSWLAFDEKKLEARIIRQPGAEDLPKEFNIKLVIEFYSR